MKCNSCGFELNGNYLFCGSCGNKIKDVLKDEIKEELDETLPKESSSPVVSDQKQFDNNSSESAEDLEPEVSYETTDPRKLEYKKLFKQVLADRRITPDEVIKLEAEVKRLGLDRADEELIQKDVAKELGIEYGQIGELCVSSVNLLINANKYYTSGQMDNLNFIVENISKDTIRDISIKAYFSGLDQKKNRNIHRLRPSERKEVNIQFHHTYSGTELVEMFVEFYDIKNNPYVFSGEFDIKIFESQQLREAESFGKTIDKSINIKFDVSRMMGNDFSNFMQDIHQRQHDDKGKKKKSSSFLCDKDKSWNMLFIFFNEEETIRRRNALLIEKKLKDGELKLRDTRAYKEEADKISAVDYESAKELTEKAYVNCKDAKECFKKVREIDSANELSLNYIQEIKTLMQVLENQLNRLNVIINKPASSEVKCDSGTLSSPNESKKYFLYSKEKISVGRNRGNDLVLRLMPLVPKEEYRKNREKSSKISGRHAEIINRPNGFYIRDTGSDNKGSTNGTFLNGKRIDPLNEYIISDGSRLNLAKVLDLECEILGDHKKIRSNTALSLSCETVLGDISSSCFGVDKIGNINAIRLRRRNNYSHGEEYIILVRELTIGSSRGNGIIIDSETVQDRHVRLLYKDNQYWIEDLNSKQGTKVNGKEIEVGVEVPLGNRSGIVIGDVPLMFESL